MVRFAINEKMAECMTDESHSKHLDFVSVQLGKIRVRPQYTPLLPLPELWIFHLFSLEILALPLNQKEYTLVTTNCSFSDNKLFF
jgi:hypothetical protein